MATSVAPLGLLALVADAWSRLPDEVAEDVVPAQRGCGRPGGGAVTEAETA